MKKIVPSNQSEAIMRRDLGTVRIWDHGTIGEPKPVFVWAALENSYPRCPALLKVADGFCLRQFHDRNRSILPSFLPGMSFPYPSRPSHHCDFNPDSAFCKRKRTRLHKNTWPAEVSDAF
jgi:hypothetical protein